MTPEQTSLSTSTPAATADGDILARLSLVIAKHESLRKTLAPHSIEATGKEERLLLDAHAEIKRLRAPLSHELAPCCITGIPTAEACSPICNAAPQMSQAARPGNSGLSTEVLSSADAAPLSSKAAPAQGETPITDSAELWLMAQGALPEGWKCPPGQEGDIRQFDHELLGPCTEWKVVTAAIARRLERSSAPSAIESPTWQPIATAPKDGREVLLRVKLRAGIPGKMLVGHYMQGGHCMEDHPPIDAGWYFFCGSAFDKASEPTHWMPLPSACADGTAKGDGNA